MVLFKTSNIVTTEVIHHGFFYTEGVKATNRTPQRTKCISSRTIEERGNQVSADLIASNCARYFINFSRKSRSIDRLLAREATIFPPKGLISRRVTSH